MEYGASSIFLRDMEMIIRVQMLMCDKVTHKTFIDSSPLFLNLSDTVFIKSASKLR